MSDPEANINPPSGEKHTLQGSHLVFNLNLFASEVEVRVAGGVFSEEESGVRVVRVVVGVVVGVVVVVVPLREMLSVMAVTAL